MDEDNRIMLAKMATDMTIALWQDKQGNLANLKADGKIPSGANPMAIFDEVYGHLYGALSDTTKK